MTRAMLLCAGYGTRLGELSDELPKPLLPVCDMPIVQFGLANLAGHGVTDIVINLHHKGALFREVLGDGRDLGVRIHYSEEPEILGTGGGLKHALSLLDPDGTDEPFISHNGKLIFDLDVGSLMAQHRSDPEVLGTLVIRPVINAREWGAVEISGETRSVEGELIHGLPRVRGFWGEGRHMFCGIHVTRPSIIARLPDGESCSLRQGYAPWIEAGANVAAYIEDGTRYFAEHSTPARYLQSNIDLLRGAHLRHPPGPLRGIDSEAHIAHGAEIREPVRIGPSARIDAGAVIGPDTVIGRRAHVGAGAHLTRTVVWADAKVPAGQHLENCIITPNGLHPGTE